MVAEYSRAELEDAQEKRLNAKEMETKKVQRETGQPIDTLIFDNIARMSLVHQIPLTIHTHNGKDHVGIISRVNTIFDEITIIFRYLEEKDDPKEQYTIIRFSGSDSIEFAIPKGMFSDLID